MAPAQDPRYLHERPDETGLEHEQQREAAETWAGPGLSLATDAQAKGFLFGTLVGGAIGLVLLLPVGFIPMAGLELWARLVICAAVGAVAGGTAGAIYMGGRAPELEGETVDADGRPSVGSSPRDPGTDQLGRPG